MTIIIRVTPFFERLERKKKLRSRMPINHLKLTTTIRQNYRPNEARCLFRIRSMLSSWRREARRGVISKSQRSR